LKASRGNVGTANRRTVQASNDGETRSPVSPGTIEYSRADLANALRTVGLRRGDSVFFQISHGSLGTVEGGSSGLAIYELLLSIMQEVIGSEGTILVPTFSFSFYRNEDFDSHSTPSMQGPWSSSVEFLEYFRKLSGVVRSVDPIFSAAGLGPAAAKLLKDLPNSSFGKDCLHERLLKIGGKICGIGVGIGEAPFLHYVEEAKGVPFRYKKLFTGRSRRGAELHKHGWIASVPIQATNGLPDGARIEQLARFEGLCRVAEVGAGNVAAIDCATFYELISREIARDPWVTARGPAGDPLELERLRIHTRIAEVKFSENASMEQMISALWRLPRNIVSDGYDAALQALSTQAPMQIHEYPTGTECWTWLVPEKWTCQEAYLETLDGQRLFSYGDNPLHVVSYSLPINRDVTREELFQHLHVHPRLPDAIPFIFKYYERDWGLCCSKNLKDSLRDDRYRVVINSDFGYGTLKVGEVVVPGKTDETFVLCAHLCHPAMVNDDLSGVVVGMEVMRELQKRQNLRYTYRFLILPETIGSVAYLSHHEDLIPKMVGGLFLEMLGLENPHALQLSFEGDTEMDRCLREAFQKNEPQGWIGAFRTVVGNDERQFNAPGVRVPMLSLSRVMRGRSEGWPYYPEYHSSFDNPGLASPVRLIDSKNLVLKMIDSVERNQVPVNLFQGEIFCSRYGLNVDAYANPEGNRALFDIIFLIDGTKSIAEIARICKVSVESVRQVVEELRVYGLVEYAGNQ